MYVYFECQKCREAQTVADGERVGEEMKRHADKAHRGEGSFDVSLRGGQPYDDVAPVQEGASGVKRCLVCGWVPGGPPVALQCREDVGHAFTSEEAAEAFADPLVVPGGPPA